MKLDELGSESRPLITGSVNVAEGQCVLVVKRITEGRIRFYNPVHGKLPFIQISEYQTVVQSRRVTVERDQAFVVRDGIATIDDQSLHKRSLQCAYELAYRYCKAPCTEYRPIDGLTTMTHLS